VKKRTSYHHGDLRNALVTAALQLIAEHGVEGFTLRDCAKKAGVSVAAPYRHFADRDDLLAAVAADCMQRLGEAMDRAIEAAGETDPLSAFRATGIAYVRFAVEHPAHFRVMNLPQVLARTPPEMRARVDAWMQEMSSRLRAAQEAGALIALPLEQILLAAGAITHGLALMIVDDVDGLGDLDPDAAAQLAIDVTGVLGLGLLPRTGPDTKQAKAMVAPAKPATPRRRGKGKSALVLALVGLGAGRAAAKPAPKLVAATAELRGRDVLVERIATPLPDGAYVLIGGQGPIGALALDHASDRDAGCPYTASLHLADDPPAGASEALVIVGPIDPARADHARIVDALGVRGPRGVSPDRAIDLDGDGKADLIVETRSYHGRFHQGVAPVWDSVAVWARAGARWSRTAYCRKDGIDTIR
jgi:AcrR family transcriptional regulator